MIEQTWLIRKWCNKNCFFQKNKWWSLCYFFCKCCWSSDWNSRSKFELEMEISHDKFVKILKEKNKYEKMKENCRNVHEKLEGKTENTRLNSVNSRTEKSIVFMLYKNEYICSIHCKSMEKKWCWGYIICWWKYGWIKNILKNKLVLQIYL